MKKRKLGKNT